MMPGSIFQTSNDSKRGFRGMPIAAAMMKVEHRNQKVEKFSAPLHKRSRLTLPPMQVIEFTYARMVELVDTRDLKSRGPGRVRAGSSPAPGIRMEAPKYSAYRQATGAELRLGKERCPDSVGLHCVPQQHDFGLGPWLPAVLQPHDRRYLPNSR